MYDQLVVISKSELAELISTTITSELVKLLPKVQQKGPEDKPIVWRTRKYVKDLLHTTYPTLDKYSEDDSKHQLLHPIRFGRRVLYRDDELSLALPKIKTLLASNNRRKIN